MLRVSDPHPDAAVPPPVPPFFFFFCPSFFRSLVVADACTNTSVLDGRDVRSVRGVRYTWGYFLKININSIYDLCGACVLGP